MEITGKVSKVLPVFVGQGRNGEWKKQEFIIEIESGNFPKKVCFSLWGEKIDQANLKEGDAVKVSFDLESREYNGRWYTEARAWRVEKDASIPGAAEARSTESASLPDLPTQENPADDLPF